jgi:hypothetical protein
MKKLIKKLSHGEKPPLPLKRDLPQGGEKTPIKVKFYLTAVNFSPLGGNKKGVQRFAGSL